MKSEKKLQKEEGFLEELDLLEDEGKEDYPGEGVSLRGHGNNGEDAGWGASRQKETALGREAAGSGKRRRSAGPYILTALGCVAVLLLIAYVALAARQMKKEGNGGENKETEEDSRDSLQAGNFSGTYTQEEVDTMIAQAEENARAQEAERILEGLKENFANGDSTALALRSFYPDEIVLASSGKIRFYPILDSLQKNRYLQENLQMMENGELQYVEDGQVITHKGIDVSAHQGTIDWQQVAQDGVEFAFLRVGYRGYGEAGRLMIDEEFENNVKGSLANGVKTGVYFFSQSVTEEEAIEEAKLVLEQISPYRITGPVVYDLEKISDSGARTRNLTVQQRTAMALAFCQTVADAGYRPMLYFNLESAIALFDLTQLEDYDKWFAHYTTDLYYPYEYKIWQYSEKGSVKGIDTEVDMDISFEVWD